MCMQRNLLPWCFRCKLKEIGCWLTEYKQYLSTCEYKNLVRYLQCKDSGTQIHRIEITQVYNGAAFRQNIASHHCFTSSVTRSVSLGNFLIARLKKLLTVYLLFQEELLENIKRYDNRIWFVRNKNSDNVDTLTRCSTQMGVEIASKCWVSEQ